MSNGCQVEKAWCLRCFVCLSSRLLSTEMGPLGGHVLLHSDGVLLSFGGRYSYVEAASTPSSTTRTPTTRSPSTNTFRDTGDSLTTLRAFDLLCARVIRIPLLDSPFYGLAAVTHSSYGHSTPHSTHIYSSPLHPPPFSRNSQSLRFYW